LNLTVAALQQLGAEAQVIRHRAAAPAVDGQRACRFLRGALDKIRDKRLVIKLDRPKLEVKTVWAKFAASGYDLSSLDKLQFRTLCSAEEAALHPEFLGALTRSPEMLLRCRCLYGMVTCYFAEWRTMEDPAAAERLLPYIFRRYEGKNPVVQKWQACPSLFSERAAAFLAHEICSDQKAVDDVLRWFYIGATTKLGLCVRASAAKSACEYLQRMEGSRDAEWSLRCLRWITEGVLSDLTPPDAFSESISSLILSQSAKRDESFQRALLSYIQCHKRLGDPRARESSPNWRSIAPEAAQRYLSWLARDSIIFFFNTILPNNSENCRRKDFWLRYHDRIKDFQVAVSDADEWKLKSSLDSENFNYYSEVAHPTTSAFLMKFEGYGQQYLIVEFSEKGHAAYIYRMADFEARGLTLRTHRFDMKNELRFDDTNRIFHSGDWEHKWASKLSFELGIRP
jgi:hypothetical protein